MEQQRIRVVVGEGRAQRQGLLGFVLEGEGMHVVATARTCAELAATLLEHRPDVVVLDDGIGSIAVSMTRQMLPAARVVLVWPRGVVAIDGDASVEPSEVLRELGATVDRVMEARTHAGGVAERGSLGPSRSRVSRRDGPRRNPSDQRPPHPSVTQLRRRGERLHPSTGMGTIEARPRLLSPSEGPVIEHRDPAPVVVLPVPSTLANGGLTSRSARADRVVVIPEVDVRRNRRRDALAKAALAAACVLLVGLAIGWSHRVTGETVRAVGPAFAPATGSGGSTSQRGRGRASEPRPDRVTDTSAGGRTLAAATSANTGTGPGVVTTSPGGVVGGGSGSGGGRSGGSGGVDTVPGMSSVHNPHGGPPGQAKDHPPATGSAPP